MRYTSFYIKNYKGIKELTLDLNKDPNSKIITLVGLNESGKTSILEAISMIEVEVPEGNRHRLIPKSRKSNFNDSIIVRAVLEFTDKDEALIQKFCSTIDFKTVDFIKTFAINLVYKFSKSVFEPNGSGVSYEFTLKGLKRNKQNDRNYTSDTEEWKALCQYIVESLKPPIIYYPNFLFDFPARIYLEKIEDETDEQETYRTAINDILDSLNDNLNLQEHVIDRMKNSNADAQEALESTIDRMSSKITSVVFEAWKLLFNSEGKQILLKTDIEDDRCFLEVKLKEGTSQFQISERSLGFKWFFTFLLFTEFRKNRATEKGEILFLLDEPASNLHSTAQKNLLGTFEKLVSNCKLIYTTHSHHLINPKWLSGAYIVRNKALDYEHEFSYDSEKTDVEATLYKQFVVMHPEQRTYFQPILDAIEYQPGLLEEVPGIIITEGKNDYYTFKYVNEVVLHKKYSELHFYPGNGADRNNQVIAMYMSWNREFIILLDGDKAGEAAKKRYVSEFGKAIETRIFTLKDFDSTFSFPTENLFSENERLGITKYYDPKASAFEKSKFNTALQTLYIDDEAIELEEETLKRFEKIFTALQ